MLKDKKQLAIGALFCSALFAPLVGIGTVYADGAEITINGGAENLYVETGSESSTDGTATYDAEAGVLTLNNYNGGGVYATGLDELTIILEGENVISMSEIDSGLYWYGIETTGDLYIGGMGSLKIDESDRTSSWGASSSAIRATEIIIWDIVDDLEKPTINIIAPTKTCLTSVSSWLSDTATGDIYIDSGVLSLDCNAAVQAENITIAGGNIEVAGSLSSVTTLSDNLFVYGGTLTINGNNGLGSNVTLDGSMEIRGGTVNINNSQYGIHFTDLSGTKGPVGIFAIFGGELNINDVDHGIRMEDANVDESAIGFLGGTTRINAKYGVAEVIYDEESTGLNIYIDDGTEYNKMFMSPSNLSVELEYTEYTSTWKEYEYYLAANGTAATNVVISDDESAIETEGDEEESDIAVPDTGSSTADHKGLIAGISAVAISVISVIVYLSRYAINRQKSKVRFSKN